MLFRKLIYCRKVLGLTQAQAAEESGLAQRDISRIENRKVKTIPHKYICYLFDKGIDLNWLFDKISALEPEAMLRNQQKNMIFTESEMNELTSTRVKYIRSDLADTYINYVVYKKELDRFPMLVLPGAGLKEFRAFELFDSNLEPALKKGDVVICTLVSDLKEVNEKQPYVIILKNNISCSTVRLQKKSLPTQVNGSDKAANLQFELVNINEKGEEKRQTVAPADILEIWEVDHLLSKINK